MLFLLVLNCMKIFSQFSVNRSEIKTIGDFTPNYKTNLSNCLIDSSHSHKWVNPGVWQNLYLNYYTYDLNKNRLSLLQKYWVPSTSLWKLQFKNSYTYDVNNNQTSFLSQNWNSNTSAWVNDSYTKFIYDINNNKILDTSTTWNSVTGHWDNSSMNIYTYDSSKNRLSHQYKSWNGSQWNTGDSVTYTYDSNNLLLLSVTYRWLGNSWIFRNKSDYYYNSQHYNTSKLQSGWNSQNSQWENGLNYVYTYDTSGNMVSISNQSWVSSAWQADEIITYSYNGNTVYRVSKQWNTSDNNFTNWYDVLDYYNCDNVGVREEKLPETSVKIFPNPANLAVSISTDAEYQSVLVTSLIGQTALRSEKSNEIPVSGLANGVYFIQLLDKNDQILKTEKFIKN